MLDSKAELSNIEFSFVFGESYLPSEMEAQIPSRAIIQGQIEIMRCLESKMKVDNKLMVSLLQNVSLNDSVFQLFLQDKILLFQGLKSIETAVLYKLSQEYFTEGS